MKYIIVKIITIFILSGTYLFSQDNVKPTAICMDQINKYAIDGKIELTAKELDFGSFDNITSSQNLRYTFSNVKPEDDINYVDSLRSSVQQIYVIVGFSVLIPMYVWDEAGNYEYCITKINILDETDLKVFGNIRYYGSQQLFNKYSNIFVESTTDNNVSFETSTNQGDFVVSLGIPGDYKLSVISNQEPLLGVTTLDLVLIQKHILHLKEFTDPIQFFAGDVRKDDEINALDLIQMRRLILGQVDSFPHNKSWRFQVKDQIFDPDKPYLEQGLEEEIYFSTYNTNSPFELQAIKTGDVNRSSYSLLNGMVYNDYNLENETMGLPSKYIAKRESLSFIYNKIYELKSGEDTVQLYIDDIIIDDSIVCVPIKVRNFTDIAGFQFSINWNKEILEYMHWNNSLGSQNAFLNVLNDEEALIICDMPMTTMPDNTTLLEICFNVKGDTGFSNLSFDSKYNFKPGFYDYLDPLPFILKSGQAGFVPGCLTNVEIILPSMQNFDPIELAVSDLYLGESDEDVLSIQNNEPLFFDCSDTEIKTFQILIDNVNGLIDSCQVTVKIIDKTPPIVKTKNNITLQLPENDFMELTYELIDNGSWDNCGIDSFSITPSYIDCDSNNPLNVEYKVFDNAGNVNTSNVKISIDPINDFNSTLACNDTLEVELSENEIIEITPEMILEGDYGCNVYYDLTLSVNKNLTFPRPDNYITFYDSNRLLYAQVRNVKNGYSCYSIIKVQSIFDGIIITLPEITAQKDSSFFINVTVQNFKNISQFFLSLSWDNSVIQYDSLIYNRDDFNLGTFFYYEDQDKKSVHTAFFADPSNGGMTLYDNQSLFRLYFTAIGQKGESTAINFSDWNTSTPNRFISSDGETQSVIYMEGKVSILSKPCDDDSIVNLDGEGKAEFSASIFYPDAQPDDEIYIDGSETAFFNCDDIGFNSFILTNEHFNGSTDTCELTVIVRDILPPFIGLKDTVTIELDGNTNILLDPDLFISFAIDNCEISSVSISPDNVSCGSANPTPVLLTILDQSGNMASATSFVKIISDNDEEPIMCNEILSIDLFPFDTMEITPELLLKNDIYCSLNYKVEIYDTLTSVTPQNDNLIDMSDVGSIYYGKSTNLSNGDYCWTEIHINSDFVVPAKFIFPEVYVGKGETIKADLRVNGFQNIESFQFGVQWDDQVVRFDSLKFPDGTDFPSKDNLLYNVFEDNVRLDYYNITQSQQFSLPDNGVLIELYFTAVGDENEISILKLKEDYDFKTEILNNENKVLIYSEKTGSITISGTLGNGCAHTFNGFPIPDVKMTDGIFTDESGCADLANVVIGTELVPEKVNDGSEAIDIMDVIILQNFILGLKNINFAQYMAADMNLDGKVSSSDIVAIQRYVIGKDDLKNIPLWMFYDATCDLIYKNVGYYPIDSCAQEIIFQGSEYKSSFIGIKKGDLNGSYNDDNFIDYNLKKDFSITDIPLLEGQSYSFDIISRDDYNLEGIQFTLDYDHDIIEDVVISSDSLKYYNFDYFVNLTDDNILVFYFFPVINEINNGTPIFTISFKSKVNSILHNAISLNANSINIVKVQGSDKPYAVNLIWENEILLSDEFYKNTYDIILYPQPAKDYVNFELEGLAKYNNMEYSLIDILGNKVEIKMLNENMIDVSHLANGIYLFVISKNNKIIQSKKMIIAR